MITTVILGWYPTAVSAFISKYAIVDWSAYQLDPPLGLINTAAQAEMFQVAFLDLIASKVDGVTRDGNSILLCKHHGVQSRLTDVMRYLESDSWVRIVLENGPPIYGKLTRVATIVNGTTYALFVDEHLLFD